MALSGPEFVKEIHEMVRAKHSKDHPIIGMIEKGQLSREALKGFVGQFYLFFPKPFPKPIAAMLSRCPDDPELERMWIENVVEEGTGEISGTDSHKGLYIRFARACGSAKKNSTVEPTPETHAFGLASYSCIRSWPSCSHAKGLLRHSNERMSVS
jgi:pyrroloquinoline quinone (PQQ) biosynthesis protein C